MTWILGEGELQRTIELKPKPRYAYAVNKIRQHGELWLLDSSEGYCLSKGETEAPGLPVWPHPDFAREFATGDWAEGYPERIPLHIWLKTSTAAGPKGGWQHVAVFFTNGNPFASIQVSAEKFNADLSAPASKIYKVPLPIGSAT